MLPYSFFPEVLKPKLSRQGLLIAEPKLGQVLTETEAMALAIQEAYLGLGMTSPNPLVGCVVLNSKNEFLSKGFHAVVGQAHAEVNALRGLSESDLKGAQVFVTLEPCAHQGRTPSCAQMLAKLPIARVVYGLKDPNPLVAGKGAQIIQDADIEAKLYHPIDEEEDLSVSLNQVCEHFLYNFIKQKPFVSLKVASSLDGQMGLKTGESKWITDSYSRELSHALRAAHDATLVGSGTVRTDNPSLDIRHPKISKANKVIILNASGDLLKRLPEMQLMKVHLPENVFVVVSDQLNLADNPAKVQIVPVSLDQQGHLEIDILLEKLWKLGIKSIFVEGGAQVLSSFLTKKAAQRLYFFQAPMILGAKGGKPWSEQVMISSMNQGMTLKNTKVIQLQQDVLTTGTFQ